jgi:methylglyoxal synthase
MTHPHVRHVALVAHDNKKAELLRWAEFNRETLRRHHLACNVASADFVISSPLLTNGYRGARPEGYEVPAAALDKSVHT